MSDGTPPSLGEFADWSDREAEYKNTIIHLQRQLARAKRKTDDLVEATYQAAKDAALSVIPTVITPPSPDRRRKGEEVALWHLTDWQGAKRTPSYNTEVMRERVSRFCEKALKITDIQRTDHPVKGCTIMLGGDMIEGIFNFPGQVFEIDSTLFAQVFNVSDLLVSVVSFALENFEWVKVVGEWGNHGRIGSKRDVVPHSDNFDRMCYEIARQRLLGDSAVAKRLVWEDSPEDIQRVEIGAYRALLIHGDEVGRNGFASPGTIVQHANRWRSGSYAWEFKDVYIGHYHTHAEWAMANGQGAVYQTGSTESENRYARDNLAASAIPSQRLHFIDPEKGRVTSQYKIHLA